MTDPKTLKAFGLVTNEQADATALSEIEALIQAMPTHATFRQLTPENLQWQGRAAAALQMWSPVQAAGIGVAMSNLGNALPGDMNYRQIVVMLHQAHAQLRRAVGPINVAIGQGQVFQYFDQLRQVIALATQDILFVDPYMEANFVATYLPHVKQGVTIRLLGRKQLAQLLPAAEMFVKEHAAKLEVRAATALHDRYVFLDGTACYNSGASFKDGGVNTGTTITQNIDAFAALKATYEGLWNNATVQKIPI